MESKLFNVDRKNESNMPLESYPLGTRAKALIGGYWMKVKLGWKWCNNGGTFPMPGGDWTGEICLPIDE